MHYTIKETAPLKKNVQVTVTAAEVDAVMDELELRYQEKAKASGFRDGKVPFDLVRQQFKGEIGKDARTKVVDQQIAVVLSDTKLYPVTQMDFADDESAPERGKDFVYSFEFYHLPDFELPEYDGASVTQKSGVVTESEIESVIADLRRTHPVRTPVDPPRLPEDGDVASIDFQVLDEDGLPYQGLQGKDFSVAVGGQNTLKPFEQALKKTMPGEEREEPVTFPEDFRHPELAGRTKTLRLKLKSLFEVSLPKLNDDFAKSVNPAFTSVERMREAIKITLEERKEEYFRKEALNELLDEMLARVSFELPEGMVERYKTYIMADVVDGLRQSGKSLGSMGKSEESLVADARKEAEELCKKQIFLLRFAQKEGIKLPDRDVTQYINREATHIGASYHEVLAEYTHSGQILTIREHMLAAKALKTLYEKLNVTLAPVVQ